MRSSIRELKRRGLIVYKDQLSDLMVINLLYYVSMKVISILSLSLGGLIIYGPLQYGRFEANYKASIGEDIDPEYLLHGFKHNFGDSFLAGLIQYLVILAPKILTFANILVLITAGASLSTGADLFDFGMDAGAFVFAMITSLVIGIAEIISIVIRYALAMTQYILVRNPGMQPMDALKASGRMMRGNKFRLFRLQLSFILWFLLMICTLTLSAIYSGPYLTAAETQLYNEIYENNVRG